MVLSLYSGRPCCYPAHGLGEIIRTILNDQVKEEITSAVESYFRFRRECRSKRASWGPVDVSSTEAPETCHHRNGQQGHGVDVVVGIVDVVVGIVDVVTGGVENAGIFAEEELSSNHTRRYPSLIFLSSQYSLRIHQGLSSECHRVSYSSLSLLSST